MRHTDLGLKVTICGAFGIVRSGLGRIRMRRIQVKLANCGIRVVRALLKLFHCKMILSIGGGVSTKVNVPAE